MAKPEVITQIEKDYQLSLEPSEAETLEDFMRYGCEEDKNQYLLRDGQLVGLDLRSNDLTDFRFLEEEELAGLEALNLTENKLSELRIPEYLSGLQYLDVSDNNSLHTLHFPESGLPALKEFDASDSGLTGLDLKGEFSSLEKMDVSRNKLTSISFPQEGCPSLTFLDLSGNQLTEVNLPGDFSQLEYAYLNNNQIRDLNFGQDLDELVVLHLKSNQLGKIPQVGYAKLETLYLQENEPLKEEYEERLLEGDESGNALEVIGLLRAAKKSGTTTNYRARLILVGNGRVGKTSLLKRLKGEKFDPNEPFTHGISIRQLNKEHLPKAKTPELYLNVWDFGGQEVFYAAHQFFLSEEAAYLYAFTDEEIAHRHLEEDVTKAPTTQYDKWRSHEYWINNIRMHGKDSPILPVKTHAMEALDNLPLERLQADYQLKFRQLNFDAGSKEDAYLKNLKKELTRVVNDHLPLLGRDFPTSYYDAIRDMDRQRKNGLEEVSVAEFEKKIARPNGITEDVDKFLLYLKKTGEVIYFPDNEALEDRVFIDSRKLIGKIYKLIENNEELEAQRGVFDPIYARKNWGTRSGKSYWNC